MIKKSIIVMSTAFLLSGIVIAQPFNRGNERCNNPRMDRISEELNLTEEQKVQFETIVDEQRAKHDSFMEQHRAETDKRLDSLLSNSQKEEFARIKEKHKSQRGPRPDKRPPF